MPNPFNYYDYGYSYGGGGAPNTILLVCAIIGLVLGIITLVLFLPARNRGRYYGATRWLYDFLNFNSYWITALLKIFNIVILTVGYLGGLICLFIQPLFGLFLIVAATVLRLLMEMTMVTLSIHQNVSNIDNTLSGGTRYMPPAPGPNAYVPPVNPQPSKKTCPNCGTVSDADMAFCMKCGKKL